MDKSDDDFLNSVVVKELINISSGQLVVFLVLGEGGEGGGNEEGEGGEEEGDENGDDEITDLDILLRKEREREKKRKVEDPQADEVGSAINRLYTFSCCSKFMTFYLI